MTAPTNPPGPVDRQAAQAQILRVLLRADLERRTAATPAKDTRS